MVNSLQDQWTWLVYSLMLLLAMLVFLSGATVLPPVTAIGERDLIDDFDTRGRISLLFLALYLMGWIAIGVLFWVPSLWHLALVNGSMSIALILAYLAPSARTRTGLHFILIAMTVYGALTVWTTPSLEVPW